MPKATERPPSGCKLWGIKPSSPRSPRFPTPGVSPGTGGSALSSPKSPNRPDPRHRKPWRGQFEAGTAAAKPRAGAGAQPKKERFGHRSQSSCRRWGRAAGGPGMLAGTPSIPRHRRGRPGVGMDAGRARRGAIPGLPWGFQNFGRAGRPSAPPYKGNVRALNLSGCR